MLAAVDPGATGAIAWLDDSGFLIEVRDLPVQKINGRSVLMPSVLAAMLREPNRMPVHCFLERVATRPGEGAVGAFSFGCGYGMLQGVLATLGVPMTLVTPTTWKRHHKLTADKGAARLRAAQLWPGLAAEFTRVRDDGRAEAALLGLYGANALQGHGSAAA